MCHGLIEGTSSSYLCVRCQAAAGKKSNGTLVKKVGAETAALAPGPAAQSADKKRILVIDDEPALCRLIKIRLEAKGYEVLEARDGESGYGILLREKPDLVISDIMMPRMTGYDLLHKLKKESGEVRKTPVIIMTSRSSMKDFFSDWEIHAFLVKPFEPEDLAAKVKDLLDRAGRFSEP